jgi:hypothetical protein
MLVDPLFQIGNAAGQLGSLILQRRNDMRFRHDQHPLDNKRISLPWLRLLKSSCWWQLLHKTAMVQHDGHTAPQRHNPLARALRNCPAVGDVISEGFF